LSRLALLDLDTVSRQSLEFDALLEVVSSETHTTAGRERVLALSPLSGLDDLVRENATVAEVRAWLVRDGVLVSGGIPDPRATLGPLSIADARIDALPLLELCLNLEAIARIRRRISAGEIHFKRLIAFLGPLPDLSAVTAPVLDGVEPDGQISDSASKTLADCRTRRTRLAGRLRRRLETILRDPSASGAIRDDFVTQRNGRYVIPVRADAAKPVRGIVHATSSSGATRFIEPLESVELNNELVELEEAERAEQERIAMAWTQDLRARLDDIECALEQLTALDTIQARARYAERVGAVSACVEAGGPLRLKGLRHPLLERHLEASGGHCVPLDLEVDPADRVLVVSGPNTGGKTVALKSVGLAVLMAQTGIPVTAVEAALPLFGQVRSDVGDHQSIEADLSTFSGHVTAMAEFLADRRPPALFLFDEIGSGTDPAEGVALAQSVLEHLAGPAVTVIATTHQNALKHWAFGDDRAASAAMEFDTATLRPTYRVLPNVVGPSAALDIAARCGLPAGLIDRARELLGEDAGRAEAYMNRLLEQLAEVEHQHDEWSRKNREADERRVLGEQRGKAEAQRHQENAARSLDRQLVSFRKQVKSALAAIEDSAARRKAEKLAHQSERKLKIDRDRAVAEVGWDKPESELARPERLDCGMTVHVQSLGRQGTIQRVDGRRVELTLGRMSVTVDAGDLRLPPSRPAEQTSAATKKPRKPVTADLQTGPPRELMLVGRTVDIALDTIDRFLDTAVLDSIHEVRLIHGHGTGRLRRAIREHLRGHAAVRDYRAGERSEGGDGATVVRLN